MPLQANNFSIEDDLSFDNWTGEDFNYSEIHKNDIFKVGSVAFSVVGILIVTALATVVIWYEEMLVKSSVSVEIKLLIIFVSYCDST